MAPPDFSKETLDGQAVEIGPGAWVLGVAHTAGGIANLKLNNRMFAFKLKLKKDLGSHSAGSDVLFLYGLGTEPSVQGIKKLEETTGLKAVAMMNNGGNHHIFLKVWYEAFPDMKIWLCPTRAHHTENQQQLREKYPDRWELADNTTTPHHVQQLLDYFDGVDCVLHNQLFVHADQVGSDMGTWRHCQEPKKFSSKEFFKLMPAMGAQDSASDEPVFYYAPLKQIIYGHQFEFMYRPSGYKDKEPLGMNGGWAWTKLLPTMLFKPTRFDSGFANNPDQRLRDPAVHAEQWQEVMKWDFEYVTGHHDPPGICGPIDNEAISKGEGGVKGHMTRQLEATGELNNTPVPASWYPWRYKNALQKVLDNEPKFVKKHGPPPELHFGGPGYGPDGLKK